MVGIGHRGAEDGHDRVADELVERALVGDHLARHRRQVFAEDVDDLLGRMPLGVGREVADVREQDRQVADLAAERERRGVVHQLVHDLGADEALEGALDPQTLALLGEQPVHRDADEGQRHGQRRVDERQPEPTQEGPVDDAEEEPPQDQHRGDAQDGAQQRQEPGEQQRPEDDPGRLEQLHPIRPPQEASRQDVGGHIRVLFHPGKDRAQRRHPQVEDPGRRGPDEHDAVADSVRSNAPRENIHGGEIAKRAGRPGVVEEHPVARVHGNRHRAHAERPAEVELEVRGRGAHRQAHRLNAERGIVEPAVFEDDRLPARRAVWIGDHGDVAEVPGRRAQARNGHAGLASRRRRVLAALVPVGKAHHRGLEWRPGGLGRGPGRARPDLEHHREHHAPALPQRLLEPAVMVGLLHERIELLLERLPDAAER